MCDRHNDLAVAIVNTNTGDINHVYEYIDSFEDAKLLAIHAMNHDRKNDYDELVVIMPGWNRKLTPNEETRVKDLADKYKVEE